MHEHSTAKMRKYRRMKFFCIISACPAGARKWHIYCFPSLAKYLNVIGHRIPANRITMKYLTP